MCLYLYIVSCENTLSVWILTKLYIITKPQTKENNVGSNSDIKSQYIYIIKILCRDVLPCCVGEANHLLKLYRDFTVPQETKETTTKFDVAKMIDIESNCIIFSKTTKPEYILVTISFMIKITSLLNLNTCIVFCTKAYMLMLFYRYIFT